MIIDNEQLDSAGLMAKDTAAASPLEVSFISGVVVSHFVRSRGCPEKMPVRESEGSFPEANPLGFVARPGLRIGAEILESIFIIGKF